MQWRFEKLTDSDRESLVASRAAEWKGSLTPKEFGARNERLYLHPFGQNRMHTYGLRFGDEVGASLDAIQIALLTRQAGSDDLKEVEASHIASVLTEKAHRNRGLATELLKTYFALENPKWSTLFSGIGPAFYERFGYLAYPVYEHSRSIAIEKTESYGERVSLEVFAKACRQWKREKLAREAVAGAVFFPDAQWWDWYGAIYQYFAEARGVTIPRGRYWRLEKGGEQVWVAESENIPKQTLEIWWSSSESRWVTDFFAAEAARRHLPKLVWWCAHLHQSKEPKLVYPMLRNEHRVPLLEVQVGDWW